MKEKERDNQQELQPVWVENYMIIVWGKNITLNSKDCTW